MMRYNWKVLSCSEYPDHWPWTPLSSNILALASGHTVPRDQLMLEEYPTFSYLEHSPDLLYFLRPESILMLLRSPVSRKVGRSVETDLFVAKLFSRCEPTKRGSAKLEEKHPHFWTSPIFYDHFDTLFVLECVHLLIRRIASVQN